MPKSMSIDLKSFGGVVVVLTRRNLNFKLKGGAAPGWRRRLACQSQCQWPLAARRGRAGLPVASRRKPRRRRGPATAPPAARLATGPLRRGPLLAGRGTLALGPSESLRLLEPPRVTASGSCETLGGSAAVSASLRPTRRPRPLSTDTGNDSTTPLS